MSEKNVKHIKWMKRAIHLASLGDGKTSPNPMVGAVIVDDRVWKKIKPNHQKIMMDIANDIGQKYQQSGREMEKKAIEVMRQYGMKIKKPSEEEIAVWNNFKDEITPDVVETFLSTEIYEKVISAINE